MFIKKLRIKNYKGFNDSGEMEFGPGFNVIVGQNNSGKSALLECFRLHGADNKPHKSAKIPKGHPLSQQSVFEFDLAIQNDEFTDILKRILQPVSTPTYINNNNKIIKSIINSSQILLKLYCIPCINFKPRGDSSILDIYKNENAFVQIKFNRELNAIDFSGVNNNTVNDGFPNAVFECKSNQFYVFKAERLTPGSYGLSDESILHSNAANLAAVLANLFSNKPIETDEFNTHVSSIFPSIKLIQAPNVGGQYRIKIWGDDPKNKREDLANFLEDSGTGIGQVLAILYVAMTMPPSVIAIDEPNSFLHPGATKKLLQILKQYPHQYIISTHSTDIISTVEPASLHLVQWQDGESKIKALDASQVRDMRIVLNEVGVGLSDVFASDQVIWVEGQTEQECFPKLARHGGAKIPLGLSFIAVHNTGDFEAKDWTARKIWELYERLSNANGILPVATAFSLDSETRTDQEKTDLSRQAEGKMHFLPRRAYENYLLHPDAIAFVMSRNLTPESTIKPAEVHDWIHANGLNFHAQKVAADFDPAGQWIKQCDAAKLLEKIVGDLSKATLEYKKTLHSVELTDWLLENDLEYLKELIDYVVGLVPKSN